jgi:hypothetical protein
MPLRRGDSVDDLLEAYPFLERPERSEEVISDCAPSKKILDLRRGSSLGLRADVQQALHVAARMTRVEEEVA